MKTLATASTLCLLALCAAGVRAQPSPFDGAWKVVLTCPAHDGERDDAKGYTHRFAAEVIEGRLSGTHKQEGEPGWHHLHGKINKAGEALLRLDGMVNNPAYAINDATRGKLYTYRVKAQFEPAAGRGQRLTGRVCEFTFSR